MTVQYYVFLQFEHNITKRHFAKSIKSVSVSMRSDPQHFRFISKMFLSLKVKSLILIWKNAFGSSSSPSSPVGF